MSNETLGIIQLALLTLAIFVGFPTAFTLLALGFVFGYVGIGHLVFDLMAVRAFQVMTNDVLISIPLFIFMGYVLERSGIMDRLFRSILVAAGPLRGSLALATVITCTIFAMATGIIGASVTIMGLLALPPMMRLQYDKRLATGSIAAGGTLGILIPPSVLLILYAANAGESIVRLYLGAFVPGFLLAAAYVV
ncbi:MAG: TRAP transporter large permease subunit, partial [bacterium]